MPDIEPPPTLDRTCPKCGAKSFGSFNATTRETHVWLFHNAGCRVLEPTAPDAPHKPAS